MCDCFNDKCYRDRCEKCCYCGGELDKPLCRHSITTRDSIYKKSEEAFDNYEKSKYPYTSLFPKTSFMAGYEVGVKSVEAENDKFKKLVREAMLLCEVMINTGPAGKTKWNIFFESAKEIVGV